LFAGFGKPHPTRVLVDGARAETLDAVMLSENFHRTAQEMNSNYEGKICKREGRKEILATQSSQA